LAIGAISEPPIMIDCSAPERSRMYTSVFVEPETIAIEAIATGENAVERCPLGRLTPNTPGTQ
jgi:hypothetical protein